MIFINFKSNLNEFLALFPPPAALLMASFDNIHVTHHSTPSVGMRDSFATRTRGQV